MANSFAFMIPLTQETKSKSRVSFKLDITLAKSKQSTALSWIMNLPPNLRKFAKRGVTFSRALLNDGNLLLRRQPEAVLAPLSYRSSGRRHQRKCLLLKVPIRTWLTPLFLAWKIKFGLKIQPNACVVDRILYHKTNKEASTVLCSVVKHLGFDFTPLILLNVGVKPKFWHSQRKSIAPSPLS